MSFLKSYRDYTSGNEAHPTYHTFAALIALSTIIGRRVWIDQGIFTIVPNLYVVLVGPSGNRKTTAMTPAKHLIRELKLPFSAESVTKEKLVLDVKDTERLIAGLPPEYKKFEMYAPMTCIVTELSEFLGGGGLGMINFLVTIYDQDYYDIRTKNKGDTSITGPYLCLLACTTPDWITIYLKQDIISGGFSRRAIFVYESTKGAPIPRPTMTPLMLTAWQEMLSYAHELMKVKGPMIWGPGLTEFYDTWYIRNQASVPSNPMLLGYFESKHIQALKIATLVSLSEGFDRVIKIAHFQFALDLLGLAEANMGRVFAGMGRNELHPVANKVLDMLSKQPTVDYQVAGISRALRCLPEKQLRAIFFHEVGTQDFDQILNHLISTGKLERLSLTDPVSRIPKLYVRHIE